MASNGASEALVLRERKPSLLWPRAAGLLHKLFRNSIVILLFLLTWELVPRLGLTDSTFLPPLSEVLRTWWKLLLSGELWEHAAASLTRSFAGFALALSVSIPLGLAIGWWKSVSAYLNPLLELFRNTAALAILPVFIMLLGLGETSKIAIVFYACVFPLLLNTISGVHNVDPLLIKSARSMGLTSVRLFYKVIIPASLPAIFVGIRQAAAGSILVLVAAEMVGAKSGLGYLIQYAQFSFLITEMYAGILTISVIGVVLNYSLLFVEKYLTGWKQSYHE